VAAWGDNYCGELGRPPFQLNQPAIQVPGLADVVDVFAGFRAAFARKRDGTMWAWGCAKYRVPDDNLLALLGDPTLPFAEGDGTATPVAIPALDAAVQIAVSSYLLGDDLDPMFMAAVTPQGQVLTWGSNYYGQLGTGSLTPSFRAAPAVVPGLADIKDIQLGWAHAVALRRDGTVWSWGVNEYGQLGRGSIGSDSAAPAQVAGLSGVTRIAAGNLASFALLGDGSVWAWGYRAAGDGRDLGSPTRVAIGSATGISASEESGIAVLSDGSVVTWGSRGGPRPVSGLLPDPIQLTSDKSSVIGYGDGRLGVLGPNGQGFLNVASPSGLTQADLRAGLTAPASPIALGSTVTLQASITNAGPDIAPASQLTVEIAENFTLASVPVGCSTVGTTLTCSAGDLASGATQTYQVAVKASGVGSAATLAGARSAVYDFDPSNDAVLVATDVTQGASVQVDVPALPLWGLIASAALMVGTAWRRIPPLTDPESLRWRPSSQRVAVVAARDLLASGPVDPSFGMIPDRG
jgi:alpha-tubulin suppressor-like RCC1 family protein